MNVIVTLSVISALSLKQETLVRSWESWYIAHDEEIERGIQFKFLGWILFCFSYPKFQKYVSSLIPSGTHADYSDWDQCFWYFWCHFDTTEGISFVVLKALQNDMIWKTQQQQVFAETISRLLWLLLCERFLLELLSIKERIRVRHG